MKKQKTLYETPQTVACPVFITSVFLTSFDARNFEEDNSDAETGYTQSL